MRPIQDGSDLIVNVDCKVAAGTYKFGNVNIIAGGVLRFADATIDFWAANILVENGGSLIAGSPTAPIGTQGGVVTIHLYGKDLGPGRATVMAARASCVSPIRDAAFPRGSGTPTAVAKSRFPEA